jgi:acyl-homoserine lactone acylase PvdQ
MPTGKDARVIVATLFAGLALLAPAAASGRKDVSRYIMAPGQFGGIPTNENSLDQLPLYDGLTPLRGNVTRRDIDRLFLPQNFKPVGTVTREPTGEPGLRILRDAYGIAHIRGKTRAALMFGSGWVTAADRSILLQLGRGPARVAVADVPGINAFGLVTSGRSFVPSAAAERLVDKERRLIVKTYGDEGRQILRDAKNYARGVNAYFRKTGSTQKPFTVNDVVAVTAFIGSIFGAGGGSEVRNSDFLAKLRAGLGRRRGDRAFTDLMAANDPEAPTTTKRPFRYPRMTGGRVTGSLVVDADSAQSAPPPAASLMSNFLTVSPDRSATGDPLAVMGPQLGYFYPEIVYQVDLQGPGIKAQGAAVPGLGMYVLLGRTPNYGWSLTSATNDVRDQFLERLCNPDGSPATRESVHYMFKGRCRAMGRFNAGVLDGDTPLAYRTTVHGPVHGTALVDGKPYAISMARSTFGRDGLNLMALKNMTEGDAKTPRDFWRIANQFEFTFNWGYVSRSHNAYFSSGRLPKRAPALDRMLPTLGNGEYEWRGFLSRLQHPHDVDPQSNGLLLSWNNKAAPGFMHGDDEHSFSSMQRVHMFDQWPRAVDIVDVVSVMNRAATEDWRSTKVWPLIRQVLGGSAAPDPQTGQSVALLDAWQRSGGHRLDRDLDGLVDLPGAAVMDAAWPRIADAVIQGGIGPLTEDLRVVQGRGGSPAGVNGSAFNGGWVSYIHKDLRTLLGRKVRGKFNLRYCGAGTLAACRASIWAALQAAAAELTAEQGPDPNAWRADATAERIRFLPGLIPNTMRWANRPTFQQVLRFDHRP